MAFLMKQFGDCHQTEQQNNKNILGTFNFSKIDSAKIFSSVSLILCNKSPSERCLSYLLR